MQLSFGAPSLSARRGCCQPLPAPPAKRRALIRAGGLQPLGGRRMEQRGRHSQVKELGEEVRVCGESAEHPDGSPPPAQLSAAGAASGCLLPGCSTPPCCHSVPSLPPARARSPVSPPRGSGRRPRPPPRGGGKRRSSGCAPGAGSGPGGCNRSSAAAPGGAERLRTRRTAFPAAAGNRYLGRRGAGRAAGGAERDGRGREGWGQDRRGLCRALLAFWALWDEGRTGALGLTCSSSEASSDPESALRTGFLLLESGAAPSRLEGWRDAVFEAGQSLAVL